MKSVVFTKDFATYKKGDECEFGSMLASSLVNKEKVAKYKEKKPYKEKAGKDKEAVK